MNRYQELAREAVRDRGARQKESELALLLELVHQLQPKIVVEIGVDQGGTLWAWCQVAHPQALVIGIDFPNGIGGDFRVSDQHRSYAQQDQQVFILVGNSHSKGTFVWLCDMLQGDRIDFLHVDGDHSYMGVSSDWKTYSPLSKVVALHDIVFTGDGYTQVDRLWRRLKKEHPTRSFEILRQPEMPSPTQSNTPWGGYGVVSPGVGFVPEWGISDSCSQCDNIPACILRNKCRMYLRPEDL